VGKRIEARDRPSEVIGIICHKCNLGAGRENRRI
jgi:hypothetical protein